MENVNILMQWVKADRRATTVRIVSLLFTIICLVHLSAHIGQWSALQTIAQGSAPDMNMLNSADQFASITSQLRFVSLLLYVITYSMWLHSSFKLIAGIVMPMRKFSASGAVVSLFVPILNFYQPYQALKELWRVSYSMGHEQDQNQAVVNWWKIKPPSIILIWWLSYLSHFIGSSLASRMEAAAVDLSTFSSYLRIAFIADVFGILSGLFLFTLVKAIRSVQTEAVQQMRQEVVVQAASVEPKHYA